MLAAELAGDGILVNACSPAAVDPRHPFATAESVATSVWLATLPDGGPTGGCYQGPAPLPW